MALTEASTSLIAGLEKAAADLQAIEHRFEADFRQRYKQGVRFSPNVHSHSTAAYIHCRRMGLRPTEVAHVGHLKARAAGQSSDSGGQDPQAEEVRSKHPLLLEILTTWRQRQLQ